MRGLDVRSRGCLVVLSVVRFHQRLEVPPLSRHEIVVGALLHHAPLGHDDDVIRLVHELELVRNEEHRFVGELLRDALPEDILGDVCVERG